MRSTKLGKSIHLLSFIAKLLRKIELKCVTFPFETSLRELDVHNIHRVGNWLSAETLANVQKIHLCLSGRFYHWMKQRADALNESQLVNFISGKSAALIDFECVNPPSDGIFVELSHHVPHIERVSELKYATTNATVNNNNGSGDSGFPSDYQAKWKFFNAFTHLKNTTLASMTVNFSDCGEAFSILAKRQTIEKLRLNFGYGNGNRGNPVKTADLNRLTRLKTLYLSNFDDKDSSEFANALFENLPALTTCEFDGKHINQDRIIELIGLAPRLKVLIFNGQSLSSCSVAFYKKLIKLRAPSDGQDVDERNRLTIHIDAGSARECLQKIGRKRYKPNIVMLRAN